MSVGGKAHKRPRKQRKTNRPPGWRVKNPVPAGPLRQVFLERVESGEMTIADVAVSAGFETADGKADTTTLQRRLGLMPVSVNRKRERPGYQPRPHDLIDSDIAGRICRALGLMPVELKDENGESIL